MSSCVHIDNENKDIFILGEGPTQGLDDTTLTAEAKHSINFTQSRKKIVLRLNYNGSNSFLFVNAIKIYQVMCLGNVSKVLHLIIWKKIKIRRKDKLFFC